MALGAAPWVLVRRFVMGGLELVAGGIALGLLCALPCTRLVHGLLFEVAPWDLTSLADALVFLSLVGLLASLIPALRVTRMDPARTLRAE